MSIVKRARRPRAVVVPVIDGPIDMDAARAALERMIRLRRIASVLRTTPASLRDQSRERPRRSARSIHALRTLRPVRDRLVHVARVILAGTSRDAHRLALRLPNREVRIAVDGMYDPRLVPPSTTDAGHFEKEGWCRFHEPAGTGPDGSGPGLVVDHHHMNDAYDADTIMSVAGNVLAEAVRALRAIIDGHAITPEEAHETCRAVAESYQRVRYEPGNGRCNVRFSDRMCHIHFHDEGGDGPWEPGEPDDPIVTSGSRLVHVSLVDDDVIVRLWRSGFDNLDPVDPMAMLRRAAVVGSVHDKARAMGMVAPEPRP